VSLRKRRRWVSGSRSGPDRSQWRDRTGFAPVSSALCRPVGALSVADIATRNQYGVSNLNRTGVRL